MSVQVKLGRWRTRDGSVAEVTSHLSSVNYPWRGISTNCWTDSGCWIVDSSEHPHDLIEYLGPLDHAPFALDAFIAGLKPGDCYKQNDGEKGQLLCRHENVIGVRGADGRYRWYDATADINYSYFPAGPWVEPPQPIERVLVVYPQRDGGRLYVAENDFAPSALFAQRITYTPGKGFELGEVVKQ